MFSTATQMTRHWLYQNIQVGNVQGADMLRVALPEALALQIVNDEYGEEAVNGLLKKKKDAYGKERGNDPNVEPPLIYADGIDYLERNKGTTAIYNLSKALGFEDFNKELTTLVDKFQERPVQFLWLYEHLKARLPEAFMKQVENDFERVN